MGSVSVYVIFHQVRVKMDLLLCALTVFKHARLSALMIDRSIQTRVILSKLCSFFLDKQFWVLNKLLAFQILKVYTSVT